MFFDIFYIYLQKTCKMKLIVSKIKKSARHLFLWGICLAMSAGIFSCSSENISSEPTDRPVSTDDASLLAWQMEKHFKTRSASFDIALVTTAVNFEFDYLICNGNYSIDWGDGIIENDTKSHTYTDNLPAHTIFIYGDFNGKGSEINIFRQDLIYADISRCPNLKEFAATSNRLTNIDLSKNIGLEHLSVGENKLSSLYLSNILNLKTLTIPFNPITNIDITKFTHLSQLNIRNTLIESIDFSNNKELWVIEMRDTPITGIDIKSLPRLSNFRCSNCPIDHLDFSQNTTMAELICNGTNITNLDLSKTESLWVLDCSNCNINDIILNPNAYLLDEVYINNNPIEQNIRKMTSIALSLPDRSATTPGTLRTLTPHISTISSLLEGYNWDIKQ